MKHFSFLLVSILSVFLLTSNLLAQDKMPLPSIFFEAKTIAIVNDTGESVYGDRAYDELKKWGRYSIVSDPKEADLVLVITSREDYVGTIRNTNAQTTANVYGTYGTATTSSTQSTRAVTSGKTFVIVFDGKKQEKVWADGKSWGTFKSATRGLIKDLKKRVEKQDKN